MTQANLAVRLGLCMLVVLFGYLTWQGLPASDGPRACWMEDSAGNRADFHLTDQPHVMVLDLGEGAVYTFPKEPGLQEGGMHVGAVGEPGRGSISVLLEDNGKFQQTMLMPGEQPIFYNGECGK